MRGWMLGRVAGTFVALALSACAQSTGVLPMGPDTYSVTTSDELGGVVAAKRAAVSEATAFCAARGQQMVAMQSQSDVRRDWAGDAVGHHDFTFRCLDPNDSQLGRPVIAGDARSLTVR